MIKIYNRNELIKKYNVPKETFLVIPRDRKMFFYSKKIGDLLGYSEISDMHNIYEVSNIIMNENLGQEKEKYDDPELYSFCRMITGNKKIDGFNLGLRGIYDFIKKQKYYKYGARYTRIDKRKLFTADNLKIK